MINNRQNGRRRGRGGGPRSPGGVPGAGNRQDNRSRGNASQLHEKYKALARDAQLAGDRVQTEYYLQFADHYFRVLNENRARFEEQRRPRDDFASYEDDDQDEAAATVDAEEQDEREPRAERQPRVERQERHEERAFRGERGDRQERVERVERPDRAERLEQSERESRDGGELRPRRSRARRERVEVQEEGEERIALDSLPPAITAAAPVVEEAEPVKTSRRRTTRRAKAAEGDEIAPAA